MTDHPHVLVTGGAGFIGSHTADVLLKRGCFVTVLDNLSTGYRANISQLENQQRFQFIHGDVTGDVKGLLSKAAKRFGPIDRIAHFAAQTAVPISVDDPATDIAVNLGGTARILEYARHNKVAKLVFASSSAVYDDDAPVPVNEESRARPASPYGIDKLAAEFFLDYYARIFGLTFTALRFMNVYGPRQDPKSWYSGVISIFLDRAVTNQPITIFDDGEQTRDFVYVSDVAEVFAESLMSDKGNSAIINIGTGVEVSINTLTRTILDLAGSSAPVKHEPPRAGDIRRSVTTMDKAVELLDFHPKVGLREGLAETLAWVRTQTKTARPPAPLKHASP